MLARLGHHPLIGRDDQHRQVNAADAGKHVLDKALVPRHVHQAHLAAGGQRQPGEAEVDGHPALFLLAQAVGVDAGQRLDQHGLAVIDVAGGSDDVHG